MIHIQLEPGKPYAFLVSSSSHSDVGILLREFSDSNLEAG